MQYNRSIKVFEAGTKQNALTRNIGTLTTSNAPLQLKDTFIK